MKEMKMLSVAIACDHAGFEMKEEMKRYFADKVFEIKDFGCFSADRVDYPDYVHPLAAAVNEGKFDFGIAICGSGNGMTMTANKYRFVRAALCWNPEIAALARKHNDANVICLPARFISQGEAEQLVDIFLTTEFEGGRHIDRVYKISHGPGNEKN